MARRIFKSLCGLTVASCLFSAVSSSPLAPSSEDIPTHGAVASQSDVCTNIGIQLLREGGNAADAQVGTVLCVGTIGMYHSGIGGGGFMLVRSANGTYEFIDFRETAPAAAFQDMYKEDPNLSILGGLARYAHVLRVVTSLANDFAAVSQGSFVASSIYISIMECCRGSMSSLRS